jgi:CRP/FNR family transcriptional regulator, cyclic AMP receptor protein
MTSPWLLSVGRKHEDTLVNIKTTSDFDATGFLQETPLFKGLPAIILASLAASARLLFAPNDFILFCQGEPADAAYIVRTGMVSLFLSSPDGRELVINEMHPGECFGELALFTDQPRSTGAITSRKSELVLLPRRAFLDAVHREAQLAWRMLQFTAERLSLSSARESALAFLDAPARLARVLLDLNRQEREKGYITISQEDLARHAGLTRQTVASVLGRWRRLGWVVTGRGHLVLLNIRFLQQIAEQAGNDF